MTMTKTSFAIKIFVVACLTLDVGAQSGRASTDPKNLKNPVPSTPASIAAGKATFQKYCRFCHGADAKGNGPMAPEGSHPPDLTDDKWDHGSTDGEIFTVIRDGAGSGSAMKGFNSKLTTQEMWQVVDYLRSIGPKLSNR
jgi:mono/diheme cytochrome c family protein